MIDITLFQQARKATQCISEAFRLFGINFSMFLRSLWPWVLGVSVLGAGMMALSLRVASLGQPEASAAMTATCLGLIAACMLSMPVWFAAIERSITGAGLWFCMRRIVVMFVAYILILLPWLVLLFFSVPVAASLGLSGITVMCFSYGALLVLLLAMLPFIHSFIACLTTPGKPLRGIVWPAYVAGFRRWWFILLTVLLLTLVSAAVQFVVMLPLNVLETALNFSNVGVVAFGDTAGLPPSFMAMMFTVAMITFILITPLHVITMLVLHLMHGSIEAGRSDGKAGAKA